jgi:hypothetical protein
MRLKSVYLGWLVLVAARSLAAQMTRLQVGVEGGASMTTITGTGAQSVSSRASDYFGALLVMQSEHSPLGFETGIAYVRKGAVNAMPGARVSFETNYVEVPLLLRVSLPLPRVPIVPTFVVGASIGFRDGCRIAFTSGGSSGANDCNSPAAGGSAFQLKAVDLGMTAGVGVDIALGSKAVLAPTIRFTRGISTISNAPNAPDAINSAVQLGVGFRLRL